MTTTFSKTVGRPLSVAEPIQLRFTLTSEMWSTHSFAAVHVIHVPIHLLTVKEKNIILVVENSHS